MVKKYCESCEEVISAARLKARPETKYCLECQEELEKSGKYKPHTMEIGQEINGWQFEGVKTVMIRGDD